MNALGTNLIWGAVQVTLLVLAGSVVYAVARRRGPALGSLAAFSLLVVVIGVSLLALSPWPNWWRLPAGAATDDSPDKTFSGQNSQSPAPTPSETLVVAKEAKPDDAGSAIAGGELPSAQRAFWAALWEGLRDAPVAQADNSWRWPTAVACALLAGMGLGLARLGLGLLAVRRFRHSTRLVSDAHLVDLLEIVRSELTCRRPVELRESAEITSPATIGWRRPVILLPIEWRDWSHLERQVVLAHEVAHVQRSDFAAWLVAQLSVAIHFYNPLVHWLAGRLRIEQEMAADTCGASVAGGRENYLTTLAAMALRQDSRAVSWAARPFLPTRGTFLRRIEMLRDTKQLRSVSHSTPGRLALLATLATIGLLVAGLRGPAAQDQSTAGVAQAPPAQADGQVLTNYVITQTKAEGPIDLAFVPADAELVVGVRPAAMMKVDALKVMFQEVEKLMKPEQFGFTLSEIELVEVVATDLAEQNVNRPAGDKRAHLAAPQIIIRATAAHDWMPLIKAQSPGAVEASMLGKKYFQAGKSDPADTCYYIADDRTLIMAAPYELPKVIGALIAPAAPKWAKQWQRVATGDAAIMVDVAALRKMIDREKYAAQWTDFGVFLKSSVAPLWEHSQRVLIGTNLSQGEGLGFLALAECSSDDAAQKVQQTAQALLTLAGNSVGELKKQTPPGQPETAVWMKLVGDAADEFVSQAKLSHEGSTVVLQSQSKQFTLLGGAALLMPVVAQARDSAKRNVSLNNARQIALAILNYEAGTRHFPPAVVIGPDGKTPHSWRVAILPYLGEKKLYEQYKMDEPWDSPENKKVLAQRPRFYCSPADDPASTNTYWFVLTGKNTMFAAQEGIRLNQITDGTQHTIVVIEAKRDVPWTKPEDIEYDPDKPLPKLGGHFEGGFIAGFVDGHIEFLPHKINESLLRAMITPAGHEVINRNQ